MKRPILISFAIAFLLLSLVPIHSVFAQQPAFPIGFEITPSVWPANSTFNINACVSNSGSSSPPTVLTLHGTTNNPPSGDWFIWTFDSQLGITINSVTQATINIPDLSQSAITSPLSASDLNTTTTVGSPVARPRINIFQNSSPDKQIGFGWVICTTANVTTGSATNGIVRFSSQLSKTTGELPLQRIIIQ